MYACVLCTTYAWIVDNITTLTDATLKLCMPGDYTDTAVIYNKLQYMVSLQRKLSEESHTLDT